MLRRLAILACCITGVLGAGFSAAAEPTALDNRLNKLGYARGEPLDRIHNYRVDGWNYLDDHHIMIYTGPSQRALITTQTACRELGSAERIGFSTTASNLTKFDKIVVRGAGGILQQCQIQQIHQLDSTKNKTSR